MTWYVEKCSSPGWIVPCPDKEKAINELRHHICSSCLRDGNDLEDSFNDLVDVVYDGKTIECRHLLTLLGTPCGLEYEVHNDEGIDIYE